MTGQSLLDRMELANAELQLQPGETDVTRGLLALNVAQDMLDSLLAVLPGVKGGAIGTVVTAASTESTAFPAGLLRIDRLQYLDPTTNRPAWDLKPVQRAGGHSGVSYPPGYIASAATGKPSAYWTDGTNIYWSPLPDGVSTVRYTGFVAASDITAIGTFAYPDICAFPLATFAVKIIKMGVDDQIQDIQAVATEVLKPAIDALSNFRRDGAKGFQYTQVHSE